MAGIPPTFTAGELAGITCTPAMGGMIASPLTLWARKTCDNTRATSAIAIDQSHDQRFQLPMVSHAVWKRPLANNFMHCNCRCSIAIQPFPGGSRCNGTRISADDCQANLPSSRVFNRRFWRNGSTIKSSGLGRSHVVDLAVDFLVTRAQNLRGVA